MFDPYTFKVPREVFEEEVRTHKADIFQPEGPYIKSNEIVFFYRRGGKRIRIIASLGEEDYVMSEKPYMERQVMAIFNRMVKYPKYELSKLPITFDIKQVMYSNPDYDGKNISFAIAYDINSSFGYAEIMPGVIPDTDREYTGRIKKGDVGIRLHKDKWIFATSGEGFKCFPLIPWDAHRFVLLYYKRKQNAKGEEKQKFKDFLTHHVGSMKYHNQIIRCWIIWNSNKHIERYKDENTILMNTDCIISLKERYDIPLGDEIGQFKVEKYGKFAKRNMDYQFYDMGVDGIKKRGLDRLERDEYDILATTTKTKSKKNVLPSSTGYNFVKGKFKK